MQYIPFDTTYNDLLVKFVQQYEWTERTKVIDAIKATFKRKTRIGINERVSEYNFQQVIDELSNYKIPHCTFASWLRAYEYKTEFEEAVEVIEAEQDVEKLETDYTRMFELDKAFMSQFEVEVEAEALEPLAECETKFEIVCDRSNNTDQDMQDGVLKLDITFRAIQPSYNVDEDQEANPDTEPLSKPQFLSQYGNDFWDKIRGTEPELKPLKIVDIFVAAFGETKEAYLKMSHFIDQCGHQITNPWQTVEAGGYVKNELLEYFYDYSKLVKDKVAILYK